MEDAALCIVKCDDGSVYQPCGCLKGSLVEANENLVTKPHLLSTKVRLRTTRPWGSNNHNV